MTGNGSKYRFSLVTVKEGIKAACLRTQAVGIKAPLQVSSEGHVIVKKSNNLISLRPIFLSPKNVRGVPRGPGPPPPAGIWLRASTIYRVTHKCC